MSFVFGDCPPYPELNADFLCAFDDYFARLVYILQNDDNRTPTYWF